MEVPARQTGCPISAVLSTRHRLVLEPPGSWATLTTASVVGVGQEPTNMLWRLSDSLAVPVLGPESNVSHGDDWIRRKCLWRGPPTDESCL